MKQDKFNTKFYILIADSHLNGDGDFSPFYQMLKRIDSLPSDYAVVFLGDNFDLWFAIPHYENNIHRRFLAWCQNAMTRRNVFFVEGNHEFYVPMYRFRYFTEVRARYIKIGSMRFIHGDLINRRDFWYFLMRAAIRNPIVECIIRLAGPTFGPGLIQKINDYLHHATANSPHKHLFPEGQMMKYLRRQERYGVTRIFAGHFHQFDRRVTDTGVSIDLIPAFFVNREISVYDVSADKITMGVWNEVFPG